MNYITGANGFIGKHLVDRLKDAVCIPHQKIASIKLIPYDTLYFLSSYGNMADQTDDKETIKANLLDVISLLDQHHSFKSFVYISTSSVKLPVQTTYSRAKRAAEEVLMSYVDKLKLPITIIRPFSVTGVGEQPSHLIPTLINAAFTGENVNFVPEPVHDFIDVEDVVDGILNLSGHQARGIFELGNGIKYSNAEVLKLVEDVTVRKIKTTIMPSLRAYDTTNWVSENYRARSFGWLPVETLKNSIEEMVYDHRVAKKMPRNIL